MAKVLLVDDDGSVLLTLAIALRRQGHDVTVASDGLQALHHLESTNYECLISDVRMPGMSGLELAEKVSALPQVPRVILTSAYSHVPIRDGTVEAFIQKPVDMAQLHELITGSPQPSSTQSQHNFHPFQQSRYSSVQH